MSKGLGCDFVAFLLSKLCGSREIHIIILVFGFSRPPGVGPYGFPKKGLKTEGTWPENSKDIVYILSFQFGFQVISHCMIRQHLFLMSWARLVGFTFVLNLSNGLHSTSMISPCDFQLIAN